MRVYVDTKGYGFVAEHVTPDALVRIGVMIEKVRMNGPSSIERCGCGGGR